MESLSPDKQLGDGAGQLPAIPPEMLQGDRRPMIYHVAAWMTLLSTLALSLRLWSRRIARQKLGVDDWLVVLSQMLEYAVCALTITTAINGVGLRAIAVYMMPDAQERFATIEKLGETLLPLVSTGLTLIKLSVLALYFRLFRSAFMKIAIYILSAMAVVWWIINVGFAIWGCKATWKVETFDGSGCLQHSTPFLTGTTVAVIAINLAIITLPMYEVLRLQMSPWNKVAVCGLFLLGGLSIVAGIVRWRLLQVYYDNEKRDPLYDYAITSIFVLLEMCAAITGVCLSTIRPFIQWLKGHVGWRSVISGSRPSKRTGTLHTIGGGSSGRRRHGNLSSVSGDSAMGGSFVRINDQTRDQHSVELAEISVLRK
ncbi:hypothetical protein PG989_002171 [Apiospora arundinis]